MQTLRNPIEATANTHRCSFLLGTDRTVHYTRFVISPASLGLSSFDVSPRTQQTLHQHAVDIAETYKPEIRPEWQKAAADLRLPFWDWARNPLPPKRFYDHREWSEVTIIHPDGTKGLVKNPLLGYQFKSGEGPAPPESADEVMKRIGKRARTVRHPISDQDGTTNIESFERYIPSHFANWAICLRDTPSLAHSGAII